MSTNPTTWLSGSLTRPRRLQDRRRVPRGTERRVQQGCWSDAEHRSANR